MTTAVVDTNVLVQAIISSPRSASVRTLRAYRERRYQLVFSVETLDELYAVLSLPTIRAWHGWTDEAIRQHFKFLLVNSRFYRLTVTASAELTRDVSDTKFLALAEQSDADFIVTNDRRHLLPLRRHRRTRIVTPAKFLLELA
jgi:putative PIN family toxin of toxin-antitoxin system